MFFQCSDITEIDLSNFNTSKVNNMIGMFNGCSSLTSLNLSNFDTSRVEKMNVMFCGCKKLSSLNLSSFDTSNVYQMANMFLSCSALTSLNISNFDTSKVQWIYNIFNGCTNLEYINMSNFNENSLIDGKYYDMFKDVPDNIVVCINKTNILNKIYDQIRNKTCYIEDCTDDWKLNQKKFINGTHQCYNNCSDTNSYEYNGRCYSKCRSGYFYYENNIAKCKCELEKCFICPTEALNNKLCTKCNVNYYPMENDLLNIGEYFNCYNETPEGYYLDINNSLYKKCYYTCKTCEINGDDEFHNCLKCNTDYIFEKC